MPQNNRSKFIHNLLTQELLEKEYQELKSIKKIAQKYYVHYTTISKKFDQFGIKRDLRTFYCEDEHMFSKDTEKSFYLAGFIAADGCINKYKNKQSRLSIFLSDKDTDFLQMLKNDLFRFDGKTYTSKIKNSKRNPAWNDTINCGFRITSNIICRDLERFNIVPRKSLIYRFPEWLTDHPLVHHFMRGYNDGDGCIRIRDSYNANKLVFSLVGQPLFLETYKNILELNCEIINYDKFIQIRNNGLGVLEYSGNIIVAKIADFLYKDATIFMDRKYHPIQVQQVRLTA
jgi:hypothetical protein